MNKKIILIICSIFMLYSIINIQSSYSSDKAIYYDAKEQKITYYNLDKDDLFNNFKNLVPGDIREQEITINTVNLKQGINMYLKFDYAINKDIINSIKIKIYKDNEEVLNDNGMYKIIGGIDKSANLKMVMEVPTSAGNEISGYNNDSFKITFLVENNGKLIEVPQTNNPKTFDKGIMPYVLLFFISLIILIITLINYSKNNFVGKQDN